MKTPPLNEVLKPLKRLEIEAKNEYVEAVRDYQAAKIVSGARRKASDKAIQAALKKGGDADAMEIAKSLLDKEDEEPVRRRYLVNDSTVEKLGVLLNQNPNGVTVFRDEMMGLLRSLDREGQEGARAFYNEAWNGYGRFTYDRIGRGTLDIEVVCVSIVGGTTPGALGDYIRAAVASGKGDDGLIQRFQLAVWPDPSRDWCNVDRWPNTEARDRAYEMFVQLNGLDPVSVGARSDDFDEDGIPFLRFTPEAQGAFDDWRGRLERTVRSHDEHPAVESHLAKYRSLIPSLALLIHLADGQPGAVSWAALEKALGWAAYLESHARRLYSHATRGDVLSAKALAAKVLANELPDGFTLREVYRPGWTGLGNREMAKQAVDVLVDFGWLVPLDEFTGGAPRIRHWVNPQSQNGKATN